MWTQFMDMHSGGDAKEEWDYIYIEASEKEAISIFYSKFGHNPHRITCTCCGNDYSISFNKSLEQITAYERGCAYRDKKYIEKPSGESWQKYVTLDKYKKNTKVKFIYADEIKDEERECEVPAQGYVWQD